MDKPELKYVYPRRVAPLAVQFTGGEEYGDQIVEWLKEYGISAEWIFAEWIFVDADLKPDTPKEYIMFKNGYRTPYVEAIVGDWIVIEPSGSVTILSDVAMKATYKGV
jgi:hypothetical protein